MNNSEIQAAIIGLIGVLVGVFVTKITNDRNNYLKNITQERKDWRNKIRELTGELYSDNVDYRLLKAKFAIRLNPGDEADKEILDRFDDLIKLSDKEEYKEEITEGIAKLLNHDWERAKDEAAVFKIKPVFLAMIIIFIINYLMPNLIKATAVYTNLSKWYIVIDLLEIVLIYIVVYYLVKNILKSLGKKEVFKSLFKFFNIPFRERIENNSNNKKEK